MVDLIFQAEKWCPAAKTSSNSSRVRPLVSGYCEKDRKEVMSKSRVEKSVERETTHHEEDVDGHGEAETGKNEVGLVLNLMERREGISTRVRM